MTRLEQYLTKMASEVTEAITHYSTYYTIDCIKVRVSDHISKNTDADIQIIKQYNGGTLYSVFMPNSIKSLLWNAKQIKEFIPYLILIKSLKRLETKCGEEYIESKTNNVCISPLTTNYSSAVVSRLNRDKLTTGQKAVFDRPRKTWVSSEIKYLPDMLRLDVGKGTGLNDAVRVFFSYISTTYEEAMNVYRRVICFYKEVPSIENMEKAYKELYENI